MQDNGDGEPLGATQERGDVGERLQKPEVGNAEEKMALLFLLF